MWNKIIIICFVCQMYGYLQPLQADGRREDDSRPQKCIIILHTHKDGKTVFIIFNIVITSNPKDCGGLYIAYIINKIRT